MLPVRSCVGKVGYSCSTVKYRNKIIHTDSNINTISYIIYIRKMHELYNSMKIILLVGTTTGPSLTAYSILEIAEALGTQYSTAKEQSNTLIEMSFSLSLSVFILHTVENSIKWYCIGQWNIYWFSVLRLGLQIQLQQTTRDSITANPPTQYRC